MKKVSARAEAGHKRSGARLMDARRRAWALNDRSAARPLRFSLREKCADAFSEVGARVTQLDQIAIGAGRQTLVLEQTARELLDRANRQRSVRRDLEREAADRRVDPLCIGQAVHEADR